jgi:N-acetylmuramate 1-kinase
MHEQIVLTPAQIHFLQQNLPGFTPDEGNTELAGRAGSQRHFIRIHHEKATYILVVWDSRDEDWPRFLAIGHDRKRTGNLLPEIVAADPRHGLILEEDLGEVTLKQYCRTIDYDSEKMVAVYQRVLDALHQWQSPQVASHPVIASRSMDAEIFTWESSYFARYCVTEFCGCEVLLDAAWEAERIRLAEECSNLTRTALHRDFQSENVLLHGTTIRFVDFQGARLGPPEYDVASLLFDPYITPMDTDMSARLYEYWCTLRRCKRIDWRPLYLCATQRIMQALGAYGNLSLHKGKQWYRDCIPVALERLFMAVCKLEDFPTLVKVVEGCCLVLGKTG